VDDGLRGTPPVNVDSKPFDWPGTEPAEGSRRGEYETCEPGGATSGASRPSGRDSADEGGGFEVSAARERFCSDVGAIPDELIDPEPAVVISGSLLHGTGTDRLLTDGGRRSGG